MFIIVGFSKFGSRHILFCYCIIFPIKDSALSPFSPQGFRGFTEAGPGSEELQGIVVFAAVGASQSI